MIRWPLLIMKSCRTVIVMLSIGKGSDAGYLTRAVGAGAEHYYLKAISQAGEPAGVWDLGAGGAELGLSGEVEPEVMHDVYHRFLDPRERDRVNSEIAALDIPKDHPDYDKAVAAIEKTGRLGSKPYDYSKSNQERRDEAYAKEPDATPERRREIELECRKEDKEAVHYFDLTFSAPKSWSIYHASLQLAGRHEEAQAVWDSWMEGVQTGLNYMQDQAGYSRAGHHAVVEGRSVGRHVLAPKWIIATFRQHTNRNDEPQLHVHNAVLNRVATVEVDAVTGEERTVWRTLNGQQLYKHKQAGGQIAERAAEEALYRRTGIRVEMRPDGKAREIVGIDQDLRDKFSTRRQGITAEVAKLAKAYEQEHGVAPSAHVLSKMSQFVCLDQRETKKHSAPTREALLASWERYAVNEVRSSLTEVPDAVRWASVEIGAPDMVFEPQKVVDAAIASLQDRKPSWTKADLIAETNKFLPDCLGGLEGSQITHLLGDLADGALNGTLSSEPVMLHAPFPIAIPDELTRPDGTYVYEPAPAGFVRYATEGHIAAEQRIRDHGDLLGAPTVNRQLVDACLATAGLNTRQSEALVGITTSGRAMEVLVGPAGTGKSRLVAAITDTWETNGGTVLGVAVSQRASDVLKEEGVTNVANMERMLQTNQRIAAGQPVSAEDRSTFGIKAGQLLIVDEAGMSNTKQLDEIRELAARAGAKVLLSGDHGQLSAVGAGGMFAQLAAELPGVYTLEQVMRFGDKVAWERDASLRLREGDGQVLGIYEDHGRLRGGTAEEMRERAYQGWLADHLDGRQSLLIAGSNAEAADLAMRARADLVRAGLVDANGCDLVREGGTIRVGVGDQVQLRQNNRKLKGDNGRYAVNRDVAQVVGITDNGGLTVKYANGDTLRLPAWYVAERVDLAYAGTVYSAQGRTVETCHSLISGTTSRENLYVALTRGKDGNYAYVITTEEGQIIPRDQEPPDVMAVLNGVLQRSEAEQSATSVIRAELERIERLDFLEGIRGDLVEQYQAARIGQLIYDRFGPEMYEFISGEEAYGSLLRLAAHVDEMGLDARAMLAGKLPERGFGDADSISKCLHWRLDRALDEVQFEDSRREDVEAARAVEDQARAVAQAVENVQTLPDPAGAAEAAGEPIAWGPGTDPVAAAEQAALIEQAAQDAAIAQFMAMQQTEVLHGLQDEEVHQRYAEERDAADEARASYVARTPDIEGPVGEHALQLAQLEDQRVAELGRRTAEEPPAWAMDRLGPVPEDPLAREDWQKRAGRIAAFREAHGYQHETDAIGRAPSRLAARARGAWEIASRALGLSRDEIEVGRASEATLRERVDHAEREERWAPDYVADQLRDATLARDDHRAQALQLQLRAQEEAERTAAEHQENVTLAIEEVQVAPEIHSERTAIEHLMATNLGTEVLHAGVDASELQAEMENRAAERAELAERAAQRAEKLEVINTARQRWFEHTGPARDAAKAAQSELERREAPEAERPEPEQLAAPSVDQQQSPTYTEEQLNESLAAARRAIEQMERRVEQQRAQQHEQPTSEDPALSPEDHEQRQRDPGFPEIEDSPVQRAAAPAQQRGEEPGRAERAQEQAQQAAQRPQQDPGGYGMGI